MHWGYFCRSMPPQTEIASGDTITIETLTQHASDDPELMISGDAGRRKRVPTGPRGQRMSTGAARGRWMRPCWPRRRRRIRRAHLHGPIAVKDAQPGDVLEVRILDIVPRPSKNPGYKGQGVRQQRRGVVGLSLQRVSRRAEAARGGDDLRDLRPRRSATCACALFLSLGAADRSLRRRAQHLRLSRHSHRAGTRETPACACSTASAFRSARISA